MTLTLERKADEARQVCEESKREKKDKKDKKIKKRKRSKEKRFLLMKLSSLQDYFFRDDSENVELLSGMSLLRASSFSGGFKDYCNPSEGSINGLFCVAIGSINQTYFYQK